MNIITERFEYDPHSGLVLKKDFEVFAHVSVVKKIVNKKSYSCLSLL